MFEQVLDCTRMTHTREGVLFTLQICIFIIMLPRHMSIRI
jgi:hypothetical protein